MIKKCDICNIEFEAKDNRTKYCSGECKKKRNALRLREYRKNMTSEQKKMESQKAKVRYEKRYIKEKKKADKRECLICKEKFIPNFNGAKTKYCSQNCADEARRIRNRDRWRAANPGWDNGTNKVCEWCGQAYTVPARNAHIARFCSDECRHRSKGHKPMEEYLEELEQQKQERLELSRQNMIKNWTIQDWEYIGGHTKGNSDIQMKCLHCNEVTTVKIDDIVGRKTWECTVECIEEVKQKRLLEKRLEKKEQWQALPVKKCTVCGNEFKSWQPTQVTCSKKCSRTHANRKKRAYDKANKSQVVVIDNDITVEGLFERDKGICHLCGDECNPKDFEIREGAFIVGPSYPSIDHLVPRSKGGVHSWENVKLAHHYCNTIKNDHEDEEAITRRIMEMAL